MFEAPFNSLFAMVIAAKLSLQTGRGVEVSVGRFTKRGRDGVGAPGRWMTRARHMNTTSPVMLGISSDAAKLSSLVVIRTATSDIGIPEWRNGCRWSES